MPLPDPKLSSIGAAPLSDVIRKTKPRYHYAAGGGSPTKFWEREPYVWGDEEGRISRFVSLGAFGGVPTEGKKQRVRFTSNLPRLVIINHLCSGFTRLALHRSSLGHRPHKLLPMSPKTLSWRQLLMR